jgi:flagellar hook-length control protein FliK
MLNQLGSSGVVSTPLAFPTSPPATLNEVIPTTSQVVPQVLTTPTNTALSDPGVQAVFDRSSRRPSQPTSREAASTSLPIQTPPLGMQYEIASTRSQVTAQASTRLTELVPVAALAQGQLTQVVHSLGKEEATQEVTSVQFVSSIPAMPPDAHLPASTPMPAESVATAALWPAADLPKLAAKPVLVASEPNPQVPAQAIAQTSIANPVDIPVAELVPKPGGASTSQQTLLAAQARQDSNQFVSGFSAAPGVGAAALPGPALVPNAQEAGVRMSERPVKHAANRFGSDGEAVYGQALATANSADAQFPVSPTSSAAASTTLAETVSHWASQGVHSASLQLDGFGDEPVEVRISVNGDMAQVDFRTNQPEVRHAIEGAASQLKDLLSGQGMQLAGMSIGTSARGAPQDKYPRHLSDVRKVSLVKSDIVEAARVRGVNPSVGQSLDLFV